jgi:hypothetical protein
VLFKSVRLMEWRPTSTHKENETLPVTRSDRLRLELDRNFKCSVLVRIA